MRTTFALICITCVGMHTVGSEELGHTFMSDTDKARIAAMLSSARSYKPLTTWEKVKLGAAYFTDPQRIRDSEIVYEYNPTSFIASEQQATLDNLASEGRILCAIRDDASTQVKPISCESIPNFPHASEPFKIISSRASLLDKTPSGVLIGEAVPEPRPRPPLNDNQPK
jgi:hypothetical protein